jgi:small-conductance mechanosensitive channel
MKGRAYSITAIGLGALLIASVAAWIVTREASPTRVPPKPQAPTSRVSKVDEHLFETARQIASLADTREGQELAMEAVRLSNQEVDQDFATSIRQAAAVPPPASGKLHDLAVRIAAFQTRVTADQQRVAQLTKDAGSNADAAGKLELASAQLTLDQDELADAQQDLEQAGGDVTATLQHAQQALQAARQSGVTLGKLAGAGPPETLREQIPLWFSLGSRMDRVDAARKEADNKAATLEAEHQGLEGKVVKAPQATSDDDSDDTATVVAQLRGLADQRKTMADLDKRGQLCHQLSGVYGQWLPLIAERRRAVLHSLIGSLSLILAILLAAALVKNILGRVLDLHTDRRRNHQLRTVSRISVHTVAALLILLVIFGAPTQTPTIIGLAGAGLTVALKDFIVSFLGWFVLMGRNGLRLGDWVEINGVGGEVIEIGVLKTVLLEMGNWTTTGHPTGRHVSFVNSFAIEGHYFNFSTAGQWLWDELSVTLPGGEPYRMAELIRQAVERQTEADAKVAEEEWERVTHQYGTRVFSAKPAADLRPGPNGLMVTIRYITRAPLRYEVKSKLFQAIVGLMHNPEKVATA